MPQTVRFWEIDILRTVAILLMIVFHFSYDILLFTPYELNIRSGAIYYAGRFAAILFIFIAGISLTLSYSRYFDLTGKGPGFIKYLKRGARIFAWGMLITLISAIFLKEGTIFFGILHFLGCAIILGYPLIHHTKLSLFLTVPLILAGNYFSNIYIDHYWLLFLGFKPYGLYTFDYFPLLPWFAVFLLGLATGNSLYPGYERKLPLPELSDNSLIKILSYPGKHSLTIYLTHQPLLVGILYLLGIGQAGGLLQLTGT